MLLIILKSALINIATTSPGVDTLAVFHIILEAATVDISAWPCKDTLTVHLILIPGARIPVAISIADIASSVEEPIAKFALIAL